MAKGLNDPSITGQATPADAMRHLIYDATGKAYYVTHANLKNIMQAQATAALPAALQSISGLVTAGNEMIYTTGANTYAKVTTTGYGRSLLNTADAAAARTLIGAAAVATTLAGYGITDAINSTEKGAANGVAPLDSGAKIAEAYLPDSIVGQVEYQGTWAAGTNTPAIPAASSSNKGHYYVTTGSVGSGHGYSNVPAVGFEDGDWIISNGSSWEKVDNSDAVTTVFGRNGNIVAVESDYQAYYPKLSSSYSNPSWITALAASKITGSLPASQVSAGTFGDGNYVFPGNLTVGNGTGSVDQVINGAAGTVRSIFFQTAGSNRWALRASSDAETGSNAGSNLEIIRRADNGVSLGTVLQIDRSTGAITASYLAGSGEIILKVDSNGKLGRSTIDPANLGSRETQSTTTSATTYNPTFTVADKTNYLISISVFESTSDYFTNIRMIGVLTGSSVAGNHNIHTLTGAGTNGSLSVGISLSSNTLTVQLSGMSSNSKDIKVTVIEQ